MLLQATVRARLAAAELVQSVGVGVRGIVPNPPPRQCPLPSLAPQVRCCAVVLLCGCSKEQLVPATTTGVLLNYSSQLLLLSLHCDRCLR